jgi:hypothetical protein
MTAISRLQNHIQSAYIARAAYNFSLPDDKPEEIFKNAMTKTNIQQIEGELRKEEGLKNYFLRRVPLKAVYNLKYLDKKYYITAQVDHPNESSVTFVLLRIGQDEGGNLDYRLWPISKEAAGALAKEEAKKYIEDKKWNKDKAAKELPGLEKKYTTFLEAKMEELAREVYQAKTLVQGIEKELEPQ